MTESGRPHLHVDADLQVDIDGVAASITGHGDTVTIRSEAPHRVWASLAHAALPSGVGRVDGPRALGRLADQLQEQGVRVHVDGPTGRLVTLGDREGSSIGRLATGSRHLTLGTPKAITPVVAARLRLTPGRIAIGAALVAALGAVLVRRSRAHS